MNEVSSRSHAVCIIIVEKCSGTDTEASSPGGWPNLTPALGPLVLIYGVPGRGSTLGQVPHVSTPADVTSPTLRCSLSR
jgi:hypothetical protein